MLDTGCKYFECFLSGSQIAGEPRSPVQYRLPLRRSRQLQIKRHHLLRAIRKMKNVSHFDATIEFRRGELGNPADVVPKVVANIVNRPGSISHERRQNNVESVDNKFMTLGQT